MPTDDHDGPWVYYKLKIKRKNDNDFRQQDGYTISSPSKPKGSGGLNHTR